MTPAAPRAKHLSATRGHRPTGRVVKGAQLIHLCNEHMTAPYLVTGATGNVGGPLVDALVQHGAEVRAAARRPRDATDQRVSPMRFDFTDPSTFDAAFDGVESMFLVRPPALTNAARDLVPALQRAQSRGLRRVVFLSVQGADRLRIVPHARIEKWLRSSGMSWTFLRASFFDQNLIQVHGQAIRERNELLMPAGRGRTAFIDAEDVAAVAADALLDPTRHHNLAWTPTGAEALTYGEVAAIMTGVLGRTIQYLEPGLVSYAIRASRDLKMPPGMIATTSLVYTTARLGLAAGLTDDVRHILGRPPTSMADFVRREHQAFEQPSTSR